MSTGSEVAKLTRVALPGGAAWIRDAVAQRRGLSVAQVRDGLVDLLRGDAPVTGRYKEDDRSVVTAVNWLGHAWVIKRMRAGGTRRVLHAIYRWLKVSPVWREWRGGRRLSEAGLRVAEPLAIVHDSAGEMLILPLVEGASLDRFEAKGGTAAQRMRLARSIGRQVGRMTAAGLINRDYKASNLLIDEACWREGAEPIVIDTAGVKSRRAEAAVYKMLAVLLRSTRLHRTVSNREALAALRAVLRADASLARGKRHRLRYAAEAIGRYPSRG